MLRWTKTEKDWLQSNYTQTSVGERSSTLAGRSYNSIKAQALRLGIARKNYRASPEDYVSRAEQLTLTDFETGWLAGIIDGEGIISLTKKANRKNLYPFIEIVNTNLPLIRKAREICKGYGHIYTYQPKERRIICFQYQINKWRDVEAITRVIYPFLLAKRGKARMTLDYIDKFIRKRRL